MNEEQPQKKSSLGKILGFGCLGIVIFTIVGGFLAYQGVRGWVDDMVDTYTDESPTELPAVNLKQDEVQALEDRVSEFATAMEKEGATETLELSADEINHLLTKNPEFADTLRVEIKDDRLVGIVSAPLDHVSEMLQGRYFNGTADLEMSFQNGRLEVYAQSVEVNGASLPEQAMAKVRVENLAKNMNKEPDIVKLLEKIESISISDGKFVIEPKAVDKKADAPAIPSEDAK